MNTAKKSLIMSLLCLSLIGCLDQKASDNAVLDTVDLDAESVDAVISNLDKTANDASEDEAPELVEVSDIGAVQADGLDVSRPDVQCNGPAIAQKCFSDGRESKKIAEFENCYLKDSRLKARGFVSLHFNNPTCSISETGNIVNRTYNLNITNPINQRYLVTSADQKNYAGDTLGGGGYLEKIQAGWSLEVAGRHEEFYSRRGRKLMDISIETGAPIEVIGTLTRQNRVITSGQLLVHHNLAKYTASYASRGLTWTEGCKCPIAGTLHVDYYNRIRERSAEVEFNQCGFATITFDNGQSRDLKLRRCLEE